MTIGAPELLAAALMILKAYARHLRGKSIRRIHHLWVRHHGEPNDLIEDTFQAALREYLVNANEPLYTTLVSDEFAKSLLQLALSETTEEYLNRRRGICDRYSQESHRIEFLLGRCIIQTLKHPRAAEFTSLHAGLSLRSLDVFMGEVDEWKKRCKNPQPGDYLSYNLRTLGDCYAFMDQWDLALESYGAAVKQSENHSERARNILRSGTMYLNKGDYRNAILRLRESLRLANMNMSLKDVLRDCESQLAWIDMMTGRLLPALEVFQRYKNSHFVGRTLFELGRFEEANRAFDAQREEIERRRSIDPPSSYRFSLAHNLRWAGRTHLALGEFRYAESKWRHANDLFGNHFGTNHVSFHRGEALLKRGQPALAGRVFRTAMDSWRTMGYLRGYVENATRLGEVLLSGHRYKDAAFLLQFTALAGTPTLSGRILQLNTSLLSKARSQLTEKQARRVDEQARAVFREGGWQGSLDVLT